MYKRKLYGAILGDLAGQPYEYGNTYKKPFRIHNPDSKVTDDTILTLASAYAILQGESLDEAYRMFSSLYPDCGFGKGFVQWLKTDPGTLGDSYGNGCLMRMSPFMYLPEPLKATMRSLTTSHDHEESYEACIRLYNLYKSRRVVPSPSKPKRFKVFTARAIESMDFIESVHAYEYGTHAVIRTAVKMKGDTDTHASILGEIENFHYKDVSDEDVAYVESKLDKFLLYVLKKFNDKI